MKFILPLTCLLFILVLVACEFEPKGVYHRTARENVTPPEIQVVELNIQQDSIYIFADSTIRFKFLSSNQSIRNVVFTMDFEKETAFESGNGVFNIDYDALTPGIHHMNVEIYTGSGSNSIAEHLGGENFVFSKLWIVVVYKPNMAKLTKSVQNGLLKLSWDKYNAPDFKEYIIYRHYNYSGSKLQIEISRTNRNEFVDSTYVGEGCPYIVKVNTVNNRIMQWCQNKFDTEFPPVYYSETGPNQFQLYWKKSIYYNAVDKINIYKTFPGDNVFLKSTSLIDDTVCNLNYSFGDEIYFDLEVIPKKTNVIYDQNKNLFHYNFGYFLGKKLDNFTLNYLKQVSNDEFVYVYNCDSVFKYSVSQKKIIAKLGYYSTGGTRCEFYGIQFSPLGRYSLNYVNNTDDAMLSDLNTMQKLYIHNLDSILNNTTTRNVPSDIGTAIIKNNVRGGFNVYDFKTSSTVGYYPATNYNMATLKFSSSGQYILLVDDSLRLIKLDNRKFTCTWKLPVTGIRYFDFDETNSDQFATWDNTKLTVRSCTNGEVIYEYPFTDSYLFNIDYRNKEILSFNSNHLFIRSYTDGSLLHDINVSYTAVSPKTFQLVNHVIVRTNGYLCFIN